jgi:glycosyltransferase involved in cell wall biosynthesis
MRILLWYWGRRGGGAQYALGLARALAQRGEVALSLSVSAQGELYGAFQALGLPMDGEDTWNGAAGVPSALLRLPALRRRLLARARAADVVLSAMAHPLTPLLAPAVGRVSAYVPVVHDATPHPGDPAFIWDWRLLREVRPARAAVALSEAVALNLAARRPGLPLIRSRLPALLACDDPAPPPPAGAPDFVFFGRLRPYKGLDLLRDAFAQLRARHPGARLRVVGEGDAEGAAPGLAALPGVTVEQRWVAEAEIPALLGSARAVVLPYREASQSGVAVQAVALGVPVVATPVGALPEQVQPGRGGILAAAPTAEAFAAALDAALAPGAPERLRAEALAARPLGEWDAVAADLGAALARVAAAR